MFHTLCNKNGNKLEFELLLLHTLQCPFDLSSIMQPDGRFLHFTKDLSMLSSTLSMDTSTIAHFSPLNRLQYLTKYTSLVGTIGVNICNSANICTCQMQN